MALRPSELIKRPAPDEEAPAPLGGTRAQMIQRLQVGLFGLFAMVLLVGLANIIMDNAAENQARVVPDSAPIAGSESAEPARTDPLADAGVVPDLPAQPQPAAPVTPPTLEDDSGAVPPRN